MPFFRANFFFGGQNLQGNKSKTYEVTVTGKADISSLSECKRQVFFNTLFQHITELMQGGDK